MLILYDVYVCMFVGRGVGVGGGGVFREFYFDCGHILRTMSIVITSRVIEYLSHPSTNSPLASLSSLLDRFVGLDFFWWFFFSLLLVGLLLFFGEVFLVFIWVF